MLGFYDYTVILTYLGVVSSIIGMSFAVEQHYLYAVICLLVSGLCDMFDGAVARTKKNRTEMEKKNGIQLDSLADVVCFGAFPAVIGYCLGMEFKYSLLFAVTGALYVLCAIIRLAYFNVTEEERQKSTDGKRKFYQGLPVTSAALIFPFLFCFRGLLDAYFPFVYAGALVVTAVCFITNFRMKKFGMKGNVVMLIAGALLFAILLVLKFNGI
ncbi:MAG: CDP-alcohol phosphatidyltransferase family protein [Lachnospiraceae bacterium]|nr:CDP-alcohol phosphatidyltransferase family protein [Lachnospiraceae bacterium]